MIALRSSAGGRVDRKRRLRFTFDGKSYEGLQGDTLASALLANGVHLVGRSFKYHRPRGILSAGSEEPNALVSVRRDEARITPNVRATQVELYEGLCAESQNRWPALNFDMGRINDVFARFFPAGFYYKTFMWPRSAWHRLYEPFIRRAAGLGRAPSLPDPDRYAQRYAHCDLLIVGAGPAGLSAALEAARLGMRVILCDEQAEVGGSLWSLRDEQLDSRTASDWIAHAASALGSADNVRVLVRTTAFGVFPHNLVGLCERLTDHLQAPEALAARERLWQVRARCVLLATGAIERPLVFEGNDRPGIMLADAASRYLNRFGVCVGSRIMLVTAHDDGYRSALDLLAAGAIVPLIVDVRDAPRGRYHAAALEAGVEVIARGTVLSTRGSPRISSALIGQVDSTGAVLPSRRVACDALLMSGGYTPSVHLYSQARGKLSWNDAIQAFVPDPVCAEFADTPRLAGACRGIYELRSSVEDGKAAAAEIHALLNGQQDAGVQARIERYIDAPPQPVDSRLTPLPRPVDAPGAHAFVDFQHDVTIKDIALATREGFQSIEHIKRYTTTGMATDQGKTSNLNALAIAAERLDKPITDIGHTTYRMPYTPVSFGSFAGYTRGELFDPVRTTATHAWAQAHDAVFENVSLWKRARYFAQHGEDMHAAVARECATVRGACGMFDASTLGKIEVVGPDAEAFLNRLYVNNFSTLAVGRCRYGLLLREDGFIYDDGVIARMERDRFHVTTTTGGAPRVLAMMEDYRQTEWQDLRVWLTSTTEQWAVVAVQGPKARDVVRSVLPSLELSSQAMPHMGVVTSTFQAEEARAFRVSFTGELGFEINVPWGLGLALWEQVYAAGQAHGMCVYGTETMHVLRAEKGYIIVGQDTDGTATCDDMGLSWAIAKTKPDFVGKRSLARAALVAHKRKQFVGLLSTDGKTVLEEGSQLLDARYENTLRQASQGHVSSAYWSPALQTPIALALLVNGRARIGERLFVPVQGGEIEVEVVAPVFVDRTGERLNG